MPEDTSSASQQSGALRAKKIRIWVRRLRSADKYEAAKHGAANGNGNGNGNGGSCKAGGGQDGKDGTAGKRFGEVDWIRCSSPHCGKWRACLRSSSAQQIRNENKV